MKQKIGIIDVGGGFRGIYAAGVLDYCMDHNIQFDLGIVVSAGSANLASYCAGQARRNYKFYTEYGRRKEYMGMGNFLHTRSYIGLEYVYGTLSNSDGESPLDYAAMIENPMEFLIVATDAETGNARYFEKQELKQDGYQAFMASSAIPVVCRPYVIDGIPYYDGALGDPVPVKKAFQMGCDKVVLLLTRPEAKIREPGKDLKLAPRIRKEFPKAACALEQRAQKYNEGVKLAQQYAAAGKAIIISPDDTCGVHTLCRDVEKMRHFYEKGYKDGKKISAFLMR